MFGERILLQGFIENQNSSTSLSKEIQENGIVAGGLIFNSMFPGDKGFALDWFASSSYAAKEQAIVNFINKSINDTYNPNMILVNPSLNGWNTRAVSAKIEPLASARVTETYVTVVFNDWIKDGVGVQGEKQRIKITLQPTTEASKLQSVIEENLSVALNSMTGSSQIEKEKKIKAIICEQLNQQLDNIPDVCIPAHATGKYFEPNDLSSMVIVFNSDNSILIKRLVLGNPDIGAIQFKSFTITVKTFASKNWITYTVIGGLGTVLALVVLILAYVLIKSSQKKKVENDDFW